MITPLDASGSRCLTRTSLPSLLTIPWLALFVPLWLTLGCSGGGSSPTRPDAPDLPSNLGGNAIFRSAAPDAHCFHQGLRRVGGHAFPLAMNLTQNGSALRGSIDWPQFRVLCSVEGTIDGDGNFTLRQTACNQPCTSFSWTSEAAMPCELMACSLTQTITGTTRGLRGDIAWRWSTTDRDDGSNLGEIDISATFDF